MEKLKYHIIFKDSPEESFNRGETLDEISPVNAIANFQAKHPGAVFLVMYCIDNTTPSIIHQIENDL